MVPCQREQADREPSIFQGRHFALPYVMAIYQSCLPDPGVHFTSFPASSQAPRKAPPISPDNLQVWGSCVARRSAPALRAKRDSANDLCNLGAPFSAMWSILIPDSPRNTWPYVTDPHVCNGLAATIGPIYLDLLLRATRPICCRTILQSASALARP